MYVRIFIPFLCPTPSLAQHGRWGIKGELKDYDVYYIQNLKTEGETWFLGVEERIVIYYKKTKAATSIYLSSGVICMREDVLFRKICWSCLWEWAWSERREKAEKNRPREREVYIALQNELRKLWGFSGAVSERERSVRREGKRPKAVAT